MGIQINGQTDTITAVDGSFTLGGSVTANVTTTSGTLTVGTGATVHSPASNTLTLGTNSAERVRIDASGRIGINGTPNATLDVQASSAELRLTSTGQYRTSLINGASGLQISQTGAKNIIFETNANERLRIDSSGRLLVGTNSATTGTSSQYSTLQVVGGSSNQAQATINLCRNENSADISLNELIGEIYFGDKQAGEYAKIKVNCDGTAAGSGDYPGRMEFHTTADGESSPTERMRITSSGDVRIGSSAISSLQGATLLALESTGSANWIEFCNSGTTNNAGLMWTDAGAAENANFYYDNNVQAFTYTSEGTHRFRTGGSERLRIDSSGRLLLGTNSDTRTTSMIISGNSFSSASQAILNMDIGTTTITDGLSIGVFRFGATGDRRGADIRAEGAGTWSAGTSHPTDLIFATNASGSASTPTERVRITSAGAVQIANGNLVFSTSGTGIDFSATTDATGMTSELFDDYEEGTFTPTLRGSTTAGTATGTIRGRYIKIGHFVHCSIRVNNVNFSGSAGDIIIDNLPYNVATAANSEYSMAAAAMVYNVSFNTSYMHGWFLNPGTSRAFGIVSRSGQTWTDWPSSEFHSSSIYMNQTLTYMAA